MSRRPPLDVPIGFVITVWSLAVFHVAVGLCYLLPNPRRYTSSAYIVVERLAPMRVWGVVFLTVAALLIVAAWVRSLRIFEVGLWFAMLLSWWWAVHFGIAALTHRDAPPTGTPLWLLVASLHWSVWQTAREVGGR